MIHPDTKILTLDVIAAEHMSDTVENVFKHYSYNMDCNTLAFATERVHITDWTGWVPLIKFIKHDECSNWFVIRGDDNKQIIVSNDQLLPVYSKETKVGFHGEVMYKWRPISANDLYNKMKDDYLLRIRDIEDEDGLIKQFSSITIEPIKMVSKGFDIVTSPNKNATWFNANGFHLINSCFVNNDILYK